MALRNRPLREGLFALAGITALGIALGGCNPIETWRSVSGANKNDPDPATAPFSGNLAAADAAPYPHLASVPPPPTRATSTAERQKLAQTLVAERSATAALGGPSPTGVTRPGVPQAPPLSAAPAAAAAPPSAPAAAAADTAVANREPP